MAVAKSIQRSCCLRHKMMHSGYRDSFAVAIVVIAVVFKCNVSLGHETIRLGMEIIYLTGVEVAG